MKNKDVCDIFAHTEQEAQVKNLFIEKNVLYSYGHHYPLCIKLFGGFIINKENYSRTTSRHRGELVRAVLDLNNFAQLIKMRDDYKQKMILMNSDEMKKIIERDVKTLEEAKNLFILESL